MTRMTRWMRWGAVAGLAVGLSGCFCSAAPGQTEASLYVSDAATGKPVRSPVFAEGSQPLTPSCDEHDTADPSLCVAQVLVVSPGAHTITVSADGYEPQTVPVDTRATDSVHAAVDLQAAK